MVLGVGLGTDPRRFNLGMHASEGRGGFGGCLLLDFLHVELVSLELVLSLLCGLFGNLFGFDRGHVLGAEGEVGDGDLEDLEVVAADSLLEEFGDLGLDLRALGDELPCFVAGGHGLEALFDLRRKHGGLPGDGVLPKRGVDVDGGLGFEPVVHRDSRRDILLVGTAGHRLLLEHPLSDVDFGDVLRKRECDVQARLEGGAVCGAEGQLDTSVALVDAAAGRCADDSEEEDGDGCGDQWNDFGRRHWGERPRCKPSCSQAFARGHSLTSGVMARDFSRAHAPGMGSPLELFRAAPVQHLDLGSTNMAYRVFGSGPALVMVHGWPLSGVTFRGLIPELQKSFTCYVPDLPGAGDTPWDPRVRDLFFDGGRRIGEFVDRLGLESFAMMGFDSGGAIARIAAAERPKRVFAMVMTNTETPGHSVQLVKTLQRTTSLPGATAMFRLLLRSRIFLRSRFGFAGAFADLSALEGDFKQATLEGLQRDPSGALLSLRNADLGVVDHLAKVHAKIDAPLLCVWGDRCGFFPVEGAQEMVASWQPEAHLEVVSGQKLMVHEESPGLVLRAMIPFLRAHAPAHLTAASG